VPTPAEQAATLHATNAYRAQVVAAATAFDGAVGSLDRAMRDGDRHGAMQAWQQAEVAVDGFRAELDGGPGAWDALDGVVAGGRGVGLRAVEASLFGVRPWSVGVRAMPALTLAGATYAVGLFRSIDQPSTIATHTVNNLGYLVMSCLVGQAAPWDGDRALEVHGVTDAVLRAAAVLVPLGRLVAPGVTAILLDATASLRMDLAVVPAHGGVSPTSAHALARDAVRVEGALGQLAGAFAGFTNGRYYA
jgi:hypothetical protein